MDDKYIFKIIFLGYFNTGVKTSLISRIVDKTFIECHRPTKGLDFRIKIVNTDYGTAKLQILDTAGQESFRSITEKCFKACHYFILGYDITNKK